MSSPGVGKTTGCHFGISGYVHVDLGITLHIGGILCLGFLSGAETRIFQENMVAVALAPCISSSSTAMVLTMQDKWFKFPALYQCYDMTEDASICFVS